MYTQESRPQGQKAFQHDQLLCYILNLHLAAFWILVRRHGAFYPTQNQEAGISGAYFQAMGVVRGLRGCWSEWMQGHKGAEVLRNALSLQRRHKQTPSICLPDKSTVLEVTWLRYSFVRPYVQFNISLLPCCTIQHSAGVWLQSNPAVKVNGCISWSRTLTAPAILQVTALRQPHGKCCRGEHRDRYQVLVHNSLKTMKHPNLVSTTSDHATSRGEISVQGNKNSK